MVGMLAGSDIASLFVVAFSHQNSVAVKNGGGDKNIGVGASVVGMELMSEFIDNYVVARTSTSTSTSTSTNTNTNTNTSTSASPSSTGLNLVDDCRRDGGSYEHDYGSSGGNTDDGYSRFWTQDERYPPTRTRHDNM
jgi:hypothetical protein